MISYPPSYQHYTTISDSEALCYAAVQSVHAILTIIIIMWPKTGFEKKVFIKMVIKLKRKKKKRGNDYPGSYSKDKYNPRLTGQRKLVRGDPCSSHRGHGNTPSSPRRTDSGIVNMRSPKHNSHKESKHMISTKILQQSKKVSPNTSGFKKSPSTRTRKLYRHNMNFSDGFSETESDDWLTPHPSPRINQFESSNHLDEVKSDLLAVCPIPRPKSGRRLSSVNMDSHEKIQVNKTKVSAVANFIDGGRKSYKKTKIKEAKVDAVANFLDGSKGGWAMREYEDDFAEQSPRHNRENRAFGSVRKVMAANSFVTGRNSNRHDLEIANHESKRGYKSMKKVMAANRFVRGSRGENDIHEFEDYEHEGNDNNKRAYNSVRKVMTVNSFVTGRNSKKHGPAIANIDPRRGYKSVKKVMVANNFVRGRREETDLSEFEEYEQEGRSNKQAYKSVRKVMAANNFVSGRTQRKFIEETPERNRNKGYRSVKKVMTANNFVQRNNMRNQPEYIEEIERPKSSRAYKSVKKVVTANNFVRGSASGKLPLEENNFSSDEEEEIIEMEEENHDQEFIELHTENEEQSVKLVGEDQNVNEVECTDMKQEIEEQPISELEESIEDINLDKIGHKNENKENDVQENVKDDNIVTENNLENEKVELEKGVEHEAPVEKEVLTSTPPIDDTLSPEMVAHENTPEPPWVQSTSKTARLFRKRTDFVSPLDMFVSPLEIGQDIEEAKAKSVQCQTEEKKSFCSCSIQ